MIVIAKYIGVKCPVCDNAFDENDDIVVCPDCGTPHHRACYHRRKKCVNLARHSEDFQWRSPLETALQGYLAVEESQQKLLEQKRQNEEPDEELKSFIEVLDRAGFPRDVYEDFEESFDRRDIFGVSEHEISSFQGVANPMMLQRFRRLANGKSKVSMNIFAGLFLPCYQFYTRQRGLGIALSVVSFLLNLPALLLYMGEVNSFRAQLSTLFANSGTLEYAATIMQYVSTALLVLFAVFGDYVYLHWMSEKIKTVRARYEACLELDGKLPTEYYHELAHMGRPSFLRMLLDTFIAISTLSILFGAGLLWILG